MRIPTVTTFVFIAASLICFTSSLAVADQFIAIRYLLTKGGFRGLEILPGFSSGQASPDGGRRYFYDIYTSINDEPLAYLSSVPSAGSRGNDSGYLFHFFPRSSATYRFQVTPSDSKGLKGPSSEWSQPFTLNLSEEETQSAVTMVADPGETVFALPGDDVVLDGSDSYDPSTGANSDLLYFWQCYSSPAEVSVTGLDTANPSFTPVETGTYGFRLSVAKQSSEGDEELAGTRSAIRYVQVQVVDDLTDSLRADPGSPLQIPLGEKIVLDGQLSKPTPADGGKYAWELLNAEQLGTSAILASSDAPVATLQPDTIGTHVFRLTVMNSDNFSYRIIPVSVYDGSKVGDLVEPNISNLRNIHCSIADINSDNEVNTEDSSLVNLAMDSGKGEAAYNKLADIDRNLRVNTRDLKIVEKCLGKAIM